MYKQKTRNSAFVKALSFYFFLLPLGALNLSITLGSVLKYIAILPLLVWLISANRNITLNKLFVSQFLFVAWLALTIVWSVESSLSFNRIVTQTFFILLLIPVSSMSFSEDEISFLRSSLVWSSRLTAVITLLFSSYLDGRLFLSGLISEDPNYLCAYFLFGIVNCILELKKAKRFIWKSFIFFELLFYVYIVLSTGSRGGVFAVSASVLIAIIFNPEEKTSLKGFFTKLGVVILVIGSIIIVVGFLPDNIKDRFLWSSIQESNGTGRYTIWENGLNVYARNGLFKQIFGCGTGSIRYYMAMNGYLDKVIHNIFLEVLIEAGIIGLFVYVYGIFAFFHESLKMKNMFAICVLIGMVVLSLSTSLYAFKPYWNILIFILCISNMKRSN